MLRVLVLSLLALWLAPAGAALTLKIATLAPDGTSWMERMRAGAEEVASRTAGRLSFRFYPGGVMGNDQAVLRRIRLGQLHGGALTVGGLAEIHPDTQIYSLPFTFRSYAEVDQVRQRMDPLVEERLRRGGFVSFGLSDGGFAYLMSARPVRGVDDLKGARVWVPEGDRISRSAFEATGVSPVSLPLTDVLTGLQTGLVDTVASSLAGAIALQWHTRVRHVTDVPLLYLYGALVVDAKIFGQASREDQAVARAVMSRVFQDLDRRSREDDAQARQALARQGIGFLESGPQERERWQAPIARAMDRLVAEGLLDAALVATLRGHLEALRGGSGGR
jgi:TRAP-type C4-dicarboxylate transport system substrate-binding protein